MCSLIESSQTSTSLASKRHPHIASGSRQTLTATLRSGGLFATRLLPTKTETRQSQPRTPAEVLELASALKKENPGRSAAQIRRILSAQHGWAPDEQRTKLLILVRGRFRLDLSVASTTLEKEGDYAVWGPGIDHSWQAEEDSIVITVRWPSIPST